MWSIARCLCTVSRKLTLRSSFTKLCVCRDYSVPLGTTQTLPFGRERSGHKHLLTCHESCSNFFCSQKPDHHENLRLEVVFSHTDQCVRLIDSTAYLLDLGRSFNFLILYKLGRDPWMGISRSQGFYPCTGQNKQNKRTKHPRLELYSSLHVARSLRSAVNKLCILQG